MFVVCVVGDVLGCVVGTLGFVVCCVVGGGVLG